MKTITIVDQDRNWNPIRTFINWCVDSCNVRKDSLRDSFINYIGSSHYELSKLQCYPHDWDSSNKGEYLISLAAGDHKHIRFLLGQAKVTWQFNSEHMVQENLLNLLWQIIDSEESNFRKCDTTDPMCYIILLINLYKHYKALPEEIKVIE